MRKEWKKRSLHPSWLAEFAILILSFIILSSAAFAGSLLVSWNAVQDARVAGYKIKYGTTTGNYPQSLSAGNVTSATLPSLTEGVTYYLVVVATDSAQVEGTPSSEVSGVVLKASSAASSSVTYNSAIVTWQSNKASNSQVNYGTTTAYGSSSPVNPTLVTSHSVTLTSLSASTTYHYQIRSTDQGGSTSVLGDFTFTTPAAPDTTPATISGVANSGVSSSAATISWTTNEASDTQVEYGTTAAYGSSTALNTAMVTSHGAALSGLTASTTYHYRVKSKDAAGNLATSGDFTFATSAAPDTTPPTISGVANSGVSSSAATISWTTNEASDSQVDYGTTAAYGSTTTLNTAMVTSHSTALSGLTASTTYHCRVKSKDAAGNLATSGDYTFATTAAPDTIPPTISGVANSGVSSSAATISWTTNEASDTQVDYGTTTAYGSSTTINTAMVTSHSAALSGLTASTTYHYRVKSKDAAGNLATSGDYTFATTAAPDTIPPTISGVASSGVSSNAATISWTTNEASDTQVDYGTTAAYGSSTVLNTSMVTSHGTALSGLTASTTHHYRVKSKDAAGNLATSGDYTFATTAAPDTTPPTISGVASSGVSSNAATISWTTNEASDTQVDYGTTAAYGSSTTLNTSMVTSHSVALSGLTASTTYHYRVKSKDAAGNLATSGDFTFATTAASDTTPPGDVQNLTAIGSDRKISLSWRTPSDSDFKGVMIRYRTDGVFPSNKNDGTLVTDLTGSPNAAQTFMHSGLANGTTYYYSAFSYDVAQNYSSTAHAQAMPLVLTITSISPTRGYDGTIVTITGVGFGISQGTSAVTFSGVIATVTTWSDTSITVTAPPNVPGGPVVVTVNGVQSNGVSFRIKLPPPGKIRING